VPTFINQAVAGEDITVFGDGSQTRSFGYISDLVAGIYKLMLSGENEPVNIGNPEEMTVKEMAELIIELTHSKSRVVYAALPEDDPKVRQPDISKAKRTLGWEPKVPVREGLIRTVEWFQANHRA
jgi:dTDP-glucose 4,6-dehydratase